MINHNHFRARKEIAHSVAQQKQKQIEQREKSLDLFSASPPSSEEEVFHMEDLKTAIPHVDYNVVNRGIFYPSVARNGRMMDKVESEHVQRNQIRQRQERKKQSQREFRRKDKERTLSRRKPFDSGADIREQVSNAKFKHRQEIAFREKQCSAVNYSAKEKEMFREMKTKNKLAKKLRKKKRQEKRREGIKTEAGLLIEPYMSHMTVYDPQMDHPLAYLRSKLSGMGVTLPDLDEYKDMINIILYIHQMSCSGSMTLDLSLTASLVLNVSSTELSAIFGTSGTLYSLLKRRSRSAKPHTEAYSDSVTWLARNFNLALESSAYKAIQTVVLTAVAWKFFPIQIAKKLQRHFGKTPVKATTGDLFVSLLENIAVLMKSFEMWFCGIPWTTCFFSADPIRDAISKGKNLLSYQDALYHGLPVDGKMCAKMFMADTKDPLIHLEGVMKTMNPFSSRYTEINTLVTKLRSARISVDGLLSRKVRAPPIAIIVHGSPGIGKSSVMEWIYQLHSTIKGRVYEPSHVFQRVVSSQYWDGYDPYSTPYIHYSEVGSKHSSLVMRSGDEAVNELTSVVDSVPFCCDMSDVKDKGKIHCLAELVVIDTNSPDLNLSHLVKNVAAYERRFIYINPRVKEEFADNFGQIDPTIESGNYYDKWTFSLYEKKPRGNMKSQTVHHMSGSETDDIHRLEEILGDMMKSRIAEGEKHNSNREKKYSFEKPHSESGILSDVSQDFLWKMAIFVGGISTLLICLFSSFAGAFASSFKTGVLELGSCYKSDMLKFRPYFMLLILTGVMCFYAHILHFFIMAVLFVLFSLDVVNMSSGILDQAIQREKTKVWKSMRQSAIQWMYSWKYVAGDNLKFVSPITPILALLGAAIPIIYLCKGYWNTGKKRYTEASSFMRKSEVVDTVIKMEDEYHCGKSYERIPVKNTKVWNHMNIAPLSHQGSLEELNKSIQRNVRACRIVTNGVTLTTYGLGLKGNFLLLNRHSCGDFDRSFELQVAVRSSDRHSSTFQKAIVDANRMVFVSSDLVVVQVPASFRDITKHFPEEITKIKHVMSYIGDDSVEASWHDDTLLADDEFLGEVMFSNTITYVWKNHDRGMCGLPIVGRRDTGSAIIGIHCAGSKDHNCYGSMLTSGAIETGITKLSKISPAPILSEARHVWGKKPHCKSPINYEDLGVIQYYGMTSVPKIRSKSRLQRTVFADDLDSLFFECLNKQRDVVYRRPMMQPQGSGSSFVSPYNLALRKMGREKKPLEPARVDACVNALVARIWSSLEKENIPKLSPIDLETAVNGISQDPFIRRLDLSKAAGYGTPGAKRNYCTRYYLPDGVVKDEVSDDILSEVLHIIECYRNGENYGPVFKAQLKDEPREMTKAQKGATRVFFATPFAYLLVQRMFLAPFYSLMVEFSDHFDTALGIDMHREANKVVNKLTRISGNIIELDYSAYDQSMPFEIGRGANTVIEILLKKLGYREEELIIVAGLLSDNLFPFVEMIGEMFCIPGMQPSGKYATAEDNSLRNSLISLYIWTSITHDSRSFYDHVAPICYGDDVLMAVSDEYKHVFNAKTFTKACESLTSLKCTTAKKGDVDRHFVSLSEMSFLKRTFVWNANFNRYVAPLDLNSIHKTLEWIIPSSCVNEFEQIEGMVNSCLRELYFMARKKEHDAIRIQLQRIYKEKRAQNLTLIKYEDIEVELL